MFQRDALKAGREYLGHNFPIIDFYDEALGAVVSTKSIDIAANSYQDVSKLTNRLNKYAETLSGILDSKFFKGKKELVWGETSLKREECSRKILEVVLPDSIITEKTANALIKFQSDWAQKGVEVIYKIAY